MWTTVWTGMNKGSFLVIFQLIMADILSANISLRTNEMGLPGPENPQLPRGFADGMYTSETARNPKIGL